MIFHSRTNPIVFVASFTPLIFTASYTWSLFTASLIWHSKGSISHTLSVDGAEHLGHRCVGLDREGHIQQPESPHQHRPGPGIRPHCYRYIADKQHIYLPPILSQAMYKKDGSVLYGNIYFNHSLSYLFLVLPKCGTELCR